MRMRAPLSGRIVLVSDAGGSVFEAGQNRLQYELVALVGATAVVVLAAALPGAQARVNAGPFALAVPANEGSLVAGISADGRYVLFASFASNLVAGDTNNVWDVFVRDRVAKTTERVSVSNGGAQANGLDGTISANGRFIAFLSDAANVVAGDTNKTSDVFVRDRVAKTTQRVSVSTGGAQANGESFLGSISGNGRFVSFSSGASNLVPGDTNNARDTFVRDRAAGTTERVSVNSGGAQANGESGSGRISGDGRFVAFGSRASNLVAGDTNDTRDVFVRDRAAGTTEQVSVSGAAAGSEINLTSISADGRYLAVEVPDSAFVIGGLVYVLDRVAKTSELVSVNSSGGRIAEWSGHGGLSADGRFVVLDTGAFVRGESEGLEFGDVFVRDRVTKTTERISVNDNGKGGNAGSISGVISADGRYVPFQSNASNLVAGDTNVCGDEGDHFNCSDVFVRNRVAGTTTLVSVGRTQAPPMQRLLLHPWPARSGRALTATALVSVVSARVTCTATLAGRKLQASEHSYRDYTARCVWKVPKNARGKQLKGSLTVTTPSGTAAKRFTGTVR